jgi:hypothetical protein
MIQKEVLEASVIQELNSIINNYTIYSTIRDFKHGYLIYNNDDNLYILLYFNVLSIIVIHKSTHLSDIQNKLNTLINVSS